NGVRPHININTSIEALKGELATAFTSPLAGEVGAQRRVGGSELDNGTPVSSQTVQRLACGGTLCRVLRADSVVVDVGRATRAVSPAQWRALKARHRTCAAPDVTGRSTGPVLIMSSSGLKAERATCPTCSPLCYFHHRLVHEGGWQVVRAGEGVKFIPPDRV